MDERIRAFLVSAVRAILQEYANLNQWSRSVYRTIHARFALSESRSLRYFDDISSHHSFVRLRPLQALESVRQFKTIDY